MKLIFSSHAISSPLFPHLISGLLVAIVDVLHELTDNLSVGFTLEWVTFLMEVLFDILVVGDDAVVDHDELCERGKGGGNSKSLKVESGKGPSRPFTKYDLFIRATMEKIGEIGNFLC